MNPTDPRVQLVKETNGNTLVISLAEEDDAGEYVCQVSTYKPIEIKHSVKIRGKCLRQWFLNFFVANYPILMCFYGKLP